MGFRLGITLEDRGDCPTGALLLFVARRPKIEDFAHHSTLLDCRGSWIEHFFANAPSHDEIN
jgi:hypothetical protein